MPSWSIYPASADRLLSFIGIGVHWSILQYVLGLPLLAFIAELIYLKTGNEKWMRLAKTFVKGFVIVFAVGAATGTASEFGLVLLWPNLTEAAGRYIYFPLYAEVFAFLMEVVFIYLLWYGWERLPKKVHVIVMLLALIGPWFSGAMIVSVNSYMVAPTGIHPAYDPTTGEWLYQQGYPKLLLAVPNDYVSLLNVTLLQQLGMEIVKNQPANANFTLVLMPVKIVNRLAYESWHGYTVKDSILYLVLKPEYRNNAQLLNTPVKAIVDKILVTTINYVGVESVTFKSPVYRASILHVLGSAITVSSFTAFAGFALRKLKGYKPEDEDYIDTGLKYTLLFALIAIAVQGFVFGHEMGRAIAYYNPEKFAAMEATSNTTFSISRAFHLEGFMKMLAYGSTSAHLPNYDKIPDDYCVLGVTQSLKTEEMSRVGSCKPPLLIHYVYYTKIGLAILVGLYALLGSYYVVIKKAIPPKWILSLALPAAVVIQMVSWMGWAVREIGRKPWTIYGVMTPDVAHTFNPAPTSAVAAVALFFIVILLALAYLVWKVLWIPGRPVSVEGE
ncbi:MAG: cytochrome ubiquinol oxidase subunit I [Desulfurococcales archaeon]|nr:cytochrome ubiquinol oxidase subunit I [Desulfurococcales archaeon]